MSVTNASTSAGTGKGTGSGPTGADGTKGPIVNAAPTVFINLYCTIVVRSHVPVVLDLKNPNYTKWLSFFRTMCGKFGLLHHIDDSALANLDDPNWVQADYSVKRWILGSDNKESCAIFLSNQFHSLVQGKLSVSDYCQCIKALADSLRDVGHAVRDSQLTLNLLRGLNPRYSNTADDIANVTPFPTFAQARSMLALKELRLATLYSTL
ncbi:uncharacterized protein LOC133930295 [Phragmites australis]|uniref:uncharacterized protein LOC133930295 n=1 Tax=Phragmites australis TaxID=29695 RepID=UPI002D794E4B|nr:uncharacterized protein LOC133930295 [Phragmites australis]